MNFAELASEHRRLAILRLLNDGAGYSLNESILTEAVNRLGVISTRDQVKTDLAWLKEQGLVTTESLHGLTVATLAARGQEVAEGRTSVPGVKRPSAKG